MRIIAAHVAAAEIRLPGILSDNMVLQQNSEVRLWGWADPQAEVRIAASWGANCMVLSDTAGRWTASVQTPGGGFTPQEIQVECNGETRTVGNVLIGEVWFAGGQSNMEMTLAGYVHCPVAGANEVIARAGRLRGRIRYAKIPRAEALEPQERAAGSWREFTPATAPECSAAAFFFAELVSDALDVPVGVIDCTWGGSAIECWLDRATLEACPDVDLTPAAIAALPPHLRPTTMYNAMVHPLAGYTIRGFLWYQGESNVARYMDYAQRMADLAALWRARWGQGDLPFYYVEIAPFDYGHDFAPLMREAQWRAGELIPNSALISTNDLVEEYERRNIHPRNKRDVGRRLAYHALSKTYGMPEVASDYPQFVTMEVAGDTAFLTFSHTEQGFNRLTDIEGFEVCGPDRVFRPARARIEGLRVAVSSPDVERPVAVRYCFRSFQRGNLANARDMPVVPFRTDDFR